MIVIFPGVCRMIVCKDDKDIVKQALAHYMPIPYKIKEEL